MPWKTIKPMDQKVQLIANWQTKNFSKTDLSKKYNISRKTVFKWIQRYEQQGIGGLKDQSQAPIRRPRATAAHIVEQIVHFKLKHPKRGPKKIYHQLMKKRPKVNWPYQVLSDTGLKRTIS